MLIACSFKSKVLDMADKMSDKTVFRGIIELKHISVSYQFVGSFPINELYRLFFVLSIK